MRRKSTRFLCKGLPRRRFLPNSPRCNGAHPADLRRLCSRLHFTIQAAIVIAVSRLHPLSAPRLGARSLSPS